MKWHSIWLIFITLLPLMAQNKPLDLKKRQGFLEVVDPIITAGEKKIYLSLPDNDGRRYFEAVFWHKRDQDPSTTSNPFRLDFFEHRNLAGAQFGSAKIPGVDTPRGKMFLLLGPPDEVKEEAMVSAGLRPGRQEVWFYPALGKQFRFVYSGNGGVYQLQDSETHEIFFEKYRNGLVLDRAEPYTLQELGLTLPHLGFTKDIENLAAEDKFELDFALSYTFFRGDDNRTELMVGFTPRDGSDRGMDVNLAAYDPFGEKTREFKKLIETKNGRYEFFSVTLEPDQYTIVLRVIDKDGREAIDRRLLDVPALRGSHQFGSGLLLAPAMDDVPLYGFLHPKRFVYNLRYFPPQNDFTNFSGERIYVNQIFYNFSGIPPLKWYVDHELVEARLEHQAVEKDEVRVIYSLPVAGLGPGLHHVKSIHADEADNLVAAVAQFALKGGQGSTDLLDLANTSDLVTIVHPAGNSVAEMDHVVARANGLKIEHMYVYLNGLLMLERDQAPWDVSMSEDLFSISGKNTLSVVLKTDKGLVKTEKELEPIEIKEKYGTRIVQIFFNAYDEELKFLPELDFSTLQVAVNGEVQEAREIKKVDEPITYCFVVDVSFSMKEAFAENISAVKKFIDGMRPQDRGYFVTFSNNYHQIMTPNNSKAILQAVADSLTLDKSNPKFSDRLYSENETYLYDAVIAAMHSQLQYSGRPVVLMVSDGVGIEGIYRRNGMLSYARESESVIYSLWLDNNPKLSDEEASFLAKEMSGGEKFARKVGLARFFAQKDSRKVHIGNKVRNESITQGILKILSEESGGFHYRIFRDDRTLIKAYVEDIAEAVGSMYVASVILPVSRADYEVDISSSDEKINIRNKSKVKVSKTNPLLD